MEEPKRAPLAQFRSHYFVGIAGLLLAIVLVGFAPTFFLKAFFNDPGLVVETADQLRSARGEAPTSATRLPPHVIAHGALATAWMVLFLTQAHLIRSDRRPTHRRLGLAGLVVAAGVSISGIAAVFLAIPRIISLADPGDPASVIAEQLPPTSGDLGSFLVFTFAVGAAVFFRHRPEPHKQLMVLASMTLLSPPIARIWLKSGVDNAVEFWLPMTENVLALLIIGGYWLLRGRIPWVLVGGFVTWIVVYSSMIGLGSTDAAQAWALGWMR